MRFPFAAIAALVLVSIARPLLAEPSLIPDTPNLSPDYFCTWNIQGFVSNYASGEAQRNAMVEANLFGKGPHQNWVDFFPTIRRDLFLVLDDSWDIPLNGDAGHFGSLMLNAERFPSFEGSPSERLRKLTDAVKAKGWRGLGGWVCAQQAPAFATPDDDAYWAERLQWMRDAGFSYWKVDWGKKDNDAVWREHLTRRAADIAPRLIVEHALAEGSLKSAAVYRTYDVENVIAAPVTISRVAHLLRAAPKGSPTLINCEDEPYIAAGTGSALGVMRHPLAGPLPSGRQDFVFPPVGRDMKRRLDEVVRCVNWHRFAGPIPLTGAGETVDPQVLADTWTLAADETYTTYRPGDRRDAAAPARIARGGLSLPRVDVDANQLAPYVLVSRSSGGAVAIATIGRTQRREYVTPKARVTQDVGTATTIGVFGVYESLTLRFDEPIEGGRVLAQDLAGNSSEDITAQVKFADRAVTIPGDLITRIGRSAASKDDVSEPGLVMVIRK